GSVVAADQFEAQVDACGCAGGGEYIVIDVEHGGIDGDGGVTLREFVRVEPVCGGTSPVEYAGCRSEERRVGQQWRRRVPGRGGQTRSKRDWSSDVCSADLGSVVAADQFEAQVDACGCAGGGEYIVIDVEHGGIDGDGGVTLREFVRVEPVCGGTSPVE